MRRVGRVGDGNSIVDQFHALPPITKGLLVSTLATTIGVMLGLVTEGDLALLSGPLFNKFEIWRLVTNTLYLVCLFSCSLYKKNSMFYEKKMSFFALSIILLGKILLQFRLRHLHDDQ